MTKKQILENTKQYFQLAIDSNLLRFTVENEKTVTKQWLTVEYQNTLTSLGGEYTWKLLCAQHIDDYKSDIELINRITLMLAEKLRSTQQDINIINDEYTLTKK